jgi:hypothetical protein
MSTGKSMPTATPNTMESLRGEVFAKKRASACEALFHYEYYKN